MYICIAHSGREVGGSEARMIIPADQTESREERSKVEEFYVHAGNGIRGEIECRSTGGLSNPREIRGSPLINVEL